MDFIVNSNHIIYKIIILRHFPINISILCKISQFFKARTKQEQFIISFHKYLVIWNITKLKSISYVFVMIKNNQVLN